ncbi:MAG TPA: FHA domain-containing protein, partial [Hyphomicrobium sp.]
MLAFGAAVVVLQAYGAAAAESGTAGAESVTDSTGFASAALAAALDAGDGAWEQVRHWVSQGYQRAPALMLGLTILLAVPPLALVGLLVSRKRPSPETTQLIGRKSSRGDGGQRMTTVRAEISAWPTEAWVEVDGLPESRRVIERTLVRIGREEDNEICLSAPTVHRYHAVVRRTTDGEVVITDLSGEKGNGVLVNGKRVAEARLAQGDAIHVGEVKLHFDARPV